MKLPDTKVVSFVGVAVALVLGGYGETHEGFSCHLCRNFKAKSSKHLLGITIWQRESVSTSKPVPPGHQHDWFRYTTSQIHGVGGWLGSSVRCSTSQFRDKK